MDGRAKKHFNFAGDLFWRDFELEFHGNVSLEWYYEAAGFQFEVDMVRFIVSLDAFVGLFYALCFQMYRQRASPSSWECVVWVLL